MRSSFRVSPGLMGVKMSLQTFGGGGALPGVTGSLPLIFRWYSVSGAKVTFVVPHFHIMM